MIIELTKEETQKLEKDKFVKHGDYFVILDNNRCYLTQIVKYKDDNWEVHLYREEGK